MSQASSTTSTRSPGGAARWTDLPAVVLLVIGYFAQKPVGVDDASIFYRYASNWAAGLGPVFNPGERVEGFSSELWTALLALGARLGVRPEWAGPALGLAFSAGVLLLAGRWARRVLPGDTLLHVAIPAAFALSSGFVFYAASGMDTPIFAFVLLAAAAGALDVAEGGRSRLFALALVALVVVRAEGPAYGALLLALAALLAPRPWSAEWKRGLALSAAAFAAAVVAVLAARALYFHDVMPASMRSKSIATHVLGEVLAGRATPREWIHLVSKGVRYESFVAPLLALPALALAARLVRRAAIAPALAIMAAVTLLNLAVTIWACGDWMPHHRHVIPVWGFVLVALAWSVTDLAERSMVPRGFAAALALAAVALAGWRSTEGSLALGNPFTARAFEPMPYGVWLREVGGALSRLDPPVVVVSNMVGELAYKAGPRTYVRDVLGLTDAHNARNGGDWVPTYGRTDPDYTFGTPFDLLHTNTARDLEDLLQHAGASGGPPPALALHVAPGWLEERFFVVTREGSPARAALASFGGSLVPFDSTVVTMIRARELESKAWTLEGLSAAVIAASARR